MRVHVPMANYQGLWIQAVKPLQQLAQSLSLGFGASVHRCPRGGKPAHVTYTHAVAVVVTAVCSHPLQRTASFDRAIGGDDEVIATTLPPQRAMVAVYVSQSQGAALTVGGAVHHNQGDLSAHVCSSRD